MVKNPLLDSKRRAEGVPETEWRQTRCHCEMDFAGGHHIYVGSDQAGTFALANEGAAGGNDGLGTRDVHGLEEDPGASRAGEEWFY